MVKELTDLIVAYERQRPEVEETVEEKEKIIVDTLRQYLSEICSISDPLTGFTVRCGVGDIGAVRTIDDSDLIYLWNISDKDVYVRFPLIQDTPVVKVSPDSMLVRPNNFIYRAQYSSFEDISKDLFMYGDATITKVEKPKEEEATDA